MTKEARNPNDKPLCPVARLCANADHGAAGFGLRASSFFRHSFVIRHSSFVTRHSSFVTRHSSLVIRHSSFVTRHSSFVTRHSSFVTRHSSLVIRHSSFVIRHSSFVIRHFDLAASAPAHQAADHGCAGTAAGGGAAFSTCTLLLKRERKSGMRLMSKNVT